MCKQLRNKRLVMALRVIFGAFMLYSGIGGFMMLFGTAPELPEPMASFMTALIGSGIFYMIKVTEVVVGAMFLFNFRPALAAIFMAPVSVGILVVNAMMTPAMLPMAVVVALFNVYFGYVYWEKYEQLFRK